MSEQHPQYTYRMKPLDMTPALEEALKAYLQESGVDITSFLKMTIETTGVTLYTVEES